MELATAAASLFSHPQTPLGPYRPPSASLVGTGGSGVPLRALALVFEGSAVLSRYGGQDCSDWQSAKDSGRGESEAGDVDWEPGRDSPQLDEGLNHLLNHPGT